jgi:glycosyltransferase involved in cell wall biosynthesis
LLLTYGLRYTLPFQNIGDVKIKKAHIVIDLFPSHPGGYKGVMSAYKQFIEQNKYDLFLYRQRCQVDYLKDLAPLTRSQWLPFSVDIDIYRKLKLPKIYDVLTSSNSRKDVYPNREKVNKLVGKMKLKAVIKRIVHQKYIKAINQTKICIISTNVFNSPNMKFTEFTSCGSFVLSDKPADMEKLGFKDGEHLVIYKDLNDLKKKILYYLKHKKERELIAKNGMEFTRKNHSNILRVQQFIKIIEDMI